MVDSTMHAQTQALVGRGSAPAWLQMSRTCWPTRFCSGVAAAPLTVRFAPDAIPDPEDSAGVEGDVKGASVFRNARVLARGMDRCELEPVSFLSMAWRTLRSGQMNGGLVSAISRRRESTNWALVTLARDARRSPC